MAISLEQMNKTVLPMFGIKTDKPLNQKTINQIMASNPAIAARVGTYNKILNGKPIVKAAKGGYLFAANELGDPRVKERMKDNPEFSEFAVDQQDATANKMQQRFAQPQDRMNPIRGYANGGDGGYDDLRRAAGRDAQGRLIRPAPAPVAAPIPAPIAPVAAPIPAPIAPVEKTVDPTNTSGATTTSIIGSPMFANMQALRNKTATPKPKAAQSTMPVLPEYTSPYNPTPPPGGYPKMRGDDVIPGGPEQTDTATTKRMPIVDGRPVGKPYDMDDPSMQPFLNSVVKAPVKQRLQYDPNSIYISPDTGKRLAYAVDINGKVNKNNSLNVDMADQRRQDEDSKALTKYNAQKAALGENFTRRQLREYTIEQGRQNDIKSNPNIEVGYYNSPEYLEAQRPQVGTMDIAFSPYFGRRGSGSVSAAEDRGYEAYLNRTGNTGFLKGGNQFTQLDTGLESMNRPSPINVAQLPPELQEAQDDRPDMQKLADAQRDLMLNTFTNPESVITPGVTENIIPSAYNEIAAGTGNITGDPSVDVSSSTNVSTAGIPTAEGPAGVMTATTVAPEVKTATDAMTAASGTVGTDAQVTAATDTTSAVSDLTAAAGTANVMLNPVKRKIEAGELVSGAANAATSAAFAEQVEAATATPSDKATVKGQLDILMDDFDGGDTPVWASGAMRAANAAMAARGLGASSMAGQAIIQATMESAIPIAQADASTIAQFEMQNLSNRQQRAMLAAQQRATFIGQEFDQEFQSRVANSARIGDIANLNFTADQQVALENSRTANTMNMANLSNSQAMVIAEAAALSQLDISNLNNRQQAAVQNAQNFMQMDMQNLSNEQQTSMFKQQQIMASLFTDQAAENAASQLNATSETQTQQFFASLANQTSQFNSTQTNAMATFDTEQTNTLKRFNAELSNQRDQFNATNGLAIAQSNAQWRQNATTLNTAAANEANMEYAKTVNGLTGTALDQLWQRERDLMSFAFTGAESAADRAVKIAIAKLTGQQQADLADNMGKGSFFSTVLTGILGNVFSF